MDFKSGTVQFLGDIENGKYGECVKLSVGGSNFTVYRFKKDGTEGKTWGQLGSVGMGDQVRYATDDSGKYLNFIAPDGGGPKQRSGPKPQSQQSQPRPQGDTATPQKQGWVEKYRDTKEAQEAERASIEAQVVFKEAMALLREGKAATELDAALKATKTWRNVQKYLAEEPVEEPAE